MADLNRFVYYACGCINYDTKTINDVPSLMDNLCSISSHYNRISKYYYIAHTETDTLHIHFIYYLSSQTRLLTLFNKLREVVKKDIRDDGAINIMKCESINAHLRYFLHIDEKSKREGKKVYSIDDIVSNDDIDIIEGFINSRKGEVDAYYLRDCVLDCNDEFELMNKLGLKVYHKYRYEIKTLQENRVRLAQQRENERSERLSEELPF